MRRLLATRNGYGWDEQTHEAAIRAPKAVENKARHVLLPACGLLFHYIAPAIARVRGYEQNNQLPSAFLRRICHKDWRPEGQEKIYARIELIAAGLQFTKGELAVAAGRHGGEFRAVLNNLQRCARDRSTGRIDDRSAQTPDWLEGRLLAANHFGPRSAGWEQKKSCRYRRAQVAFDLHEKSFAPSLPPAFQNQTWRCFTIVQLSPVP